MAYVLSISITQEQKVFLKDNNISPSKLLQYAITEKMMEQKEGIVMTNQELRRKVISFQDHLTKQREFIEKNGLMEEFLKENGY